MRATSITNGGGTLVADQLNGLTPQFDKIRLSSAGIVPSSPGSVGSMLSQPQSQQQPPIGPVKTSAAIVAASLGKSIVPPPGSPQTFAQPPPSSGLGSGFNAPGGFRQTYGGNFFGAATTTIINENEFPSLTSAAVAAAQFQPVGQFNGSKDVPSSFERLQRIPYAHLIRGPILEAGGNSEFKMQNEDFPALPGAPASTTTNATGNTGAGSGNASSQQLHTSAEDEKRRMTQIPPGMLNDQYGMAGILTFLKTIDKSSALVQLALGYDLTDLGLNLNSPERNLYQSFGGPFSDTPARTQDIEVPVPEEYRTMQHIKEKLPVVKLSKLPEDTLFFLFYNCPNEAYQMVAAAELYAREWRYHKTLQTWLTRSTYAGVRERTETFEKGSYSIFDHIQWRKIPKEMKLVYQDLEQRPVTLTNEIKSQMPQPTLRNLET